MIRKHENPDSFKAGFYALAVHVGLLAAMLVSFNWKAAHPVMNVTEVELWDKLPKSNPAVEPPKLDEPKPVIEPKPIEPKPVVEDKPKPDEPKVDIELEKKKKEELIKKEKELVEKIKKEDAAKKLAQQMREEDLQEKKDAKKTDADALKKLQQDALSEEKGNDDKQASAANASLIGEYKAKIQAKIRGNVNRTLCGDGNPELKFSISLLPTGELAGAPKLTKSSGIDACDEAVERAIIASQPLPLPTDPSLFSSFRNLNLSFTPNN